MNADNITLRGLADFELPEQVARRHRAWAALTSLADGLLDADDVRTLYGFSEDDLEPYRAEWEQTRAGSHAQ